MRNVLISYPEFSGEDQEWLENLKLSYADLDFPPVGPHFTLVFPFVGPDEAQFIQHVRRVVTNFRRIPCNIRCAIPVPDTFSDNTHIFLVPDEGFGAIVRLHDALYQGVLAEHLRLDIPFIPHITVGYAPDAQRCKEICDQINRQLTELRCVLREVDVLRQDADGIRTVSRIHLGA